MPRDKLERFMIDVPCAGGCGAKERIAEPPVTRPALRLVAGVVYAVNLTAKGWEWTDGKWWCKGCRVRRRMIKALP